MAPNPTKILTSVDHKLARIYPASDGDEIVISGMSGRFPNSKNIAEYEHNLYNKVDMVDDAETRWKHFNAEIPKRCGKIQDLDRFDATFFGVHFKQAHTMDPQCRILLECAYEAILDAGVNPKSLAGTRTGVFVGACISESEKTWFYDKACSGGFGITGCSRAMLANRISYILGFNGPSYLIDTACSSSMYALDNAFTAFRNGEIDAAIVGGANLVMHPYVTLQFARLGVLALNGYCRPFDQDATGYTRSEAVNCLFLQRKRDARRIYASVIYSKTNCDGYKTEGITYPSGLMQEKLLKEFYENVDISPRDLGYLEAHSTGTVVGDPEECRAIDNVLCAQRDEPLLVGSVKSNIGHSEASSGICSLVKVMLAFHKGKVAPNINLTNIRKEIPALTEGRLKVVTEVTDLCSPYIGVNSFGFGGANAHTLLKAYGKEKVNFGVPKDNLPRLITWSGRTEESVDTLFNAVESNPLDAEYVALLHSIQRDPIPGLVFRGYGLYSHSEGKNAQCLAKNVQHYTGINRPIVWVFSGMGSQWTEMGSSLMNIPLFRQSIEKCHRTLEPKGLNLIKILTSTDPTTYDNILHSFVGIAAIQIALVDILKALEIEPDYIIGHSVGELGCAYADGAFTAEQMILSSYSRGAVSVEMSAIKGSMAAVGLGFKDLVKMLPPSIEVACHNGPDSSTISGPCEDVNKFVAELKAKRIFAKEVPCSNIAYHSRYIAHMGPALLKRLKEVIPNPKPRSAKWLSTSVPKTLWDVEENQLCSAEYHTNNLLSSVLFEETAALLPPNALTIEIAPHSLLQAILRKSMPNAVHIGLTQRENKNNMRYFFEALGKIYLNGLHFPIDRLYPAVQFPVSRGTPMISSKIRWDHSEEWYVAKFESTQVEETGERSIPLNLEFDNDEFLGGHLIDGKVLVPASAYLLYVWETLSLMRYGPSFMDMPVEFEDVKFIRATPLSKGAVTTLIVMIHYGTGNFEISENGAVVVTGTVRELENAQTSGQLPPLEPSKAPIVQSKDFYKELRLRGYHYNGAFKAVQEARSDGAWAKIKWNYNWVTFIDCILQSHIIGTDSRNLLLPTRIRKMRINGKHHYNLMKNMDLDNLAFEVQSSRKLERIICGGIEIIGLHASPVARRKPPGVPVLERYQFISNFPAPKLDVSDAVRACVQLALENDSTLKLKIVEVDTEKSEPIITHFIEAFEDLPIYSADYIVLTPKEFTLTGVYVENKKLSTQQNCHIVIAKNMFNNDDFVDEVQKSLNERAFFLTREKSGLNVDDLQTPIGFHIIAVIPTDNETFVLLQRLEKKYYGSPTVVQISESDTEFMWVEKVQNALKGPVLLVAQKEKFNGLIGMVNCLRKEVNGDLIKCVFIDDPNAPPFDMELPFYKNHLKLGMAINVFRNGKWGTYRHLQLKQEVIEKPHKGLIVGNAKVRGDLSSMAWFGGPSDLKEYDTKVVYASLNFRDVMFATGRLSIDLYGESRVEQSNVLGFEYAGIDKSGKRTMGMILKGAVASYCSTNDGIKWIIPDNLTFEEAATIPVVYFTVYYAFFYSSDIRKGKSILIHAGTGGVGLAAIRVALAYGLEIYTTCSTKEKRQYLLDTFPQIKGSHIGNSRDTSFEAMIMEETDGKGVDFVLNSLAEDKLLASIRCLAKGGHFLEIGKFDMANDSKVGLAPFLKELTFHAVLADNIFTAPVELQKQLIAMIQRDMMAGIVKPLPVTIFKGNELEKAFRYLAGGKHIGKVVVQVRDDPKSEYTIPLKVYPRVYFDKDLVYVIPGGLGGFGLELADWLVLRGARKLVLSSRTGITNTYQTYRIYLWETYGVKVIINTADITTRQGCEALIKEGLKMGAIGGIFNLAVLLQDAVFMNQTAEKFMKSLAPKAFATRYLDEFSRKMCPQLQHFVVFSSVSCGRGNAGQTNYGMANSIMERIIEDRVSHGYPGKAIQWGAVGEVGLVADLAENKIDMEIGGTLLQRISSCLQELDPLLDSPDPIVASMVVAEKRAGSRGSCNVVETIMNIMGIRDLKSVSMGATLAEMGMDSLMAVEIKQSLERDFELFLSPQDLRSLTFQKLQEISDAKEGSTEIVKIRLASNEKVIGINLLLRNLGDESNSNKMLVPLMTMSTITTGINPTIIIPGLEGTASQVWYNIGTNLKAESVVLQLTHTVDCTSIGKISQTLFENILPILKQKEPFYIVGYSYGSLIAIELSRLLEQAGFNGELLLIDGAPVFLNKLCRGHLGDNVSDEKLINALLTAVVHQIFPEESEENVAAVFIKAKDWDEKMTKFTEFSERQNIYSKEYGVFMVKALFNRIKALTQLDVDKIEPINSPITLVRSAEVSIIDIEEDYELSKIAKGKITLKFIEGDHTTMLDNEHLPQIINECNPGFRDDKFFEDYLESKIKMK